VVVRVCVWVCAVQVGALKTEQPLAWRLLGRLRCRCPLYGSGNGSACGWEGDYSELGAHLTSSDAHLAEAKGAAAAASAAALNEQANQRFMQARVAVRAVRLCVCVCV
jgi:DnaJ family protein C protein 7